MHLYQAGMPLALLTEWLGHADPETTLSRSADAASRPAISRMSSLRNASGGVQPGL